MYIIASIDIHTYVYPKIKEIKKAMDSTNQTLSSPTLLITIIILLYLFIYSKLSKPKKASKKPPQAGGAWPIIGHLHKLSGTGLPHMTLGAMADQYGSAFTIQLGTKQALVVSSWKVAKECFTTNDRALASRPSSIASKIMGYNNGIFALAPYSQYWRELRKIAVQEFLSNRRLESLKHTWKTEIEVSMKELHDTWASTNNKNNNSQVLVEMKQWFTDLTMNIVMRLVVGKRWFGRNASGIDEAEARQCERTMKRFFTLAGTFMVEDSVPLVGWLDVQGYRREMRSIARELERVLEGLLEEHKCRRRDGKAEQEQDFMDVMLSALKEKPNFTDRDPDTVNKSTCLTLILGASDTTMVTLTWTLSLLLNNPHVLKKAQEELMAQVGNDRHVDESDIKNLVYLQAIIKETMRLYPPAPLSGPREAIEDAVVAGYHVPVGMRVIVNLWKIQRDPSIWTDPLEFQPERFLTTHQGVNVWGQHYELIPFGSGRRSCPGIALALQVVQLTLARLLHGFELIRPSGALVDMTESVGLTNVKVTPVEVLLAPRLPPQLYEA
ncbi:hypothetical protein Scep_020463 [Stephania cephalantha]|uniref:Cytochrome P450 n=1 Tax=Stephania cephalantha TaxID=152367 RepID=A0AAP0NP07_9MAGN